MEKKKNKKIITDYRINRVSKKWQDEQLIKNMKLTFDQRKKTQEKWRELPQLNHSNHSGCLGFFFFILCSIVLTFFLQDFP